MKTYNDLLTACKTLLFIEASNLKDEAKALRAVISKECRRLGITAFELSEIALEARLELQGGYDDEE